MKDALMQLMSRYDDAFGESRIIPLYLAALLIICIFYISEEDKRRRINPAVFLLSVWVSIVYAVVLGVRVAKRRWEKAAIIFFSVIALAFSGISGLNFSPAFVILQTVSSVILILIIIFRGRIRLAIADTDDDGITYEDSDDQEEELDMKKHKILNIRNMTIAFAVFIIAFAAAVFVLNSKINSLHTATVGLQKSIDDKCGIYEFRADEEGDCAGFLLTMTDGSVCFYGGGPAGNGKALFEFIQRFGGNVDKWYLYSEEEDDKGAYDYCIEQGLKVNNAYVMKGIEEVR